VKTLAEGPLADWELQLWNALKSLGEKSLERVGRDIQSETGLSAADFGVLSRLEDLGGGTLRQQELADSMGWQRSRLSHHLTRMEERELVERGEGKTARSTALTITTKGRDAIRASRPVHAKSIRRHILSHLKAEDRKLLLALAYRLTADD
jgi:DNA-binding MarR family transcriptional regulator